MGDTQPTGPDGISELREQVRQLACRVASLEQGRDSAEAASAPDGAAAAHAPRHVADDAVAKVFTRVAMLSFALLGALVLRTLTQQHILAAGFGTILGFAYAGHLILLSILPGRLGRLARETSIFQCCGVALAFAIALEACLRAQTLGRSAAMLLVSLFAAAALSVATRHRKAVLAATALAGGPLALVALGLESDGLGLQLLSLVVFAAAGAALSWRRAWSLLRPLAFLLFLLLVSVGFALAHKQALGRAPLLACAAAFWGVVAVQHLLALRRLGWSAAWLPLATGWLAGLAWFEGWPALAYAAAVVSAAAVAAGAVLSRRSRGSVAGMAGLAATAVLAGLIGGPSLDSSGILCAFAGVALWAAIRQSQPALAAGSAVILLMAASAYGIRPLVQSGASLYPLFAGTVLSSILMAHYLRTSRPGPDAPAGLAQHLAPLALAAAVIVFFATLRYLAHRLLPDPASYQLVLTAMLVTAAALMTFVGRAAQRRAVLYGGLACMILSLLKVALIDLQRLSGMHLLASVVLLAASSVAVSVIMRRRPAPGAG